MPRPTRSLFPPFAGVALADILANSAAIVIIMIVVTLMAGHEEEQDKLEQAEDVAVLLSRELATSFVMNALPTSPPAQLHDYVTWPPDRNPQHALMPIIELHNGYVRDYYTGAEFPRDELLRQDNAFDAYLSSLTDAQLVALRIDVYGIREFYIAMSILKAHGHSPRHWHFLASRQRGDGAPTTPGRWAGQLRRDRAGLELPDGTPGADPLGTPSTGSWLPEDVALAGATDTSNPYPEDDLGLGSGSPAGEYLELPPSDGERRGSEPTSSGDAPGDTASGVGRSTPVDSPGTRFRAARPVGRTLAGEMDFDLYSALRGLFAFMKSVQQDADANRPSPLPDYDFLRDVLARAAEPVTPVEDRLLRNLAGELAMPVEDPHQTLTVVSRSAAGLRGQALAVPVNRPLYLAIRLRGPQQPVRTGEEEAKVTLRLGLHPAIYEGLRVPLGRDGMVLMPSGTVGDPSPRWRVVTLVDARVDDFVTGFVFAGVDESGRLQLSVDDNAVEIGGLSAESRFPTVSLGGEFRQMLLYGLIAALFAAGIVARVWRRA